MFVLACLASIGTQGLVMRCVRQSNSTSERAIRVHGVQDRRPFDPLRMSSWLPDERAPIIQPNTCTGPGCCPGNIYNPSAVNNGDTCWNVYFGGWDGVRTCKDSVSVAVTVDSFASIHPHVPMIATGTCQHVNNPSVVRETPGSWGMVYTQDNNNINKPGVSLGTNGLDWKPNSGGSTFLIMRGYPFGWGTPTSGADVNGGNVIHHDPNTGRWHFFFTDFKQLHNASVFHAIGSDGLGGAFTYEGVAVAQPRLIVNDIKRVNGHYLLGLHHNGQQVFSATSTDLNTFPAAQVLFSNAGDDDKYITSVGFVVDANGTRLLGALYGAGAVASLDHNRIFARWLQQRVEFVSEDGELLWSSGSAEGPDIQLLRRIKLGGQQPMPSRGRFFVYAADYENATTRGTLLYRSGVVNAVAGDVWQLEDSDEL